MCIRDSATTYARLQEFRDVLTVEVAGNARVVRSSGGAATGSVVSEGMGYGLLLAGITAAAEARGSASWRAAIWFGEQLFAGWRRMCEESRESCQDDDPRARCGGRLKRTGEGPTRCRTPCVRYWRFDNQIRKQSDPGSAVDADEDALLGLVLLVQASDRESWPGWETVALWAYESCRAFLRFNTLPYAEGRLPRLGSCWGGWDCANPS